MQPELSIVTITWNNLAGLESTISSIRSQEVELREQFEVIIVDNMSSDGSDAFVAAIDDLPMSYIRERDSGIYDALNKGTDRAQAAHILYLNAGDELRDSTSLRTMMDLARTNPSAPVVVCGAVQRNADGSETLLRNVPHSWFRHAFGLRSACHAAMIFRSDAVRAASGYSLESDFAGDFDLILRLGLLGSFANDPTVCITYDGTGLSARRKKEIPLLLHRIRSRRFQYTRWARSIDRAFVALLEFYRSTRRLTSRT